MYNAAYGNGIGESKSLSRPGETYTPLEIGEQHRMINSYGLAFLNAHLRADYAGEAGAAASAGEYNAEYLKANRFDAAELRYAAK